MAAALRCVYDNSNMFLQDGSITPLPKPYLPSIPPAKTQKKSYSRFIHEAPWLALSGTKYDTKPPPKAPSIPKCQKRALVGLTNRWRIPENVASDLLGSSQAMKSVFVPYNESSESILSADYTRTSFNHTAPQLSRSSHKDVAMTDVPAIGSRDHLRTAPADMLNCEHRNSRWQANNRVSRSQGRSSDLKTQVQQVRFNKSVPPLAAHEPTPMELFLYHSQATTCARGADVILYALGTAWELHKPYFQKSGLLKRMVKEANEQSLVAEMMSDSDNETLEKQAPSRSAVDLHAVKSAVGVSIPTEEKASALKLVRTPSFGHAMVLKLKVKDPLLTKQAFALALGSLYVDHVKMDDTDVVGVLAAANLLEFGELKKTCVDAMLKTISASTVCAYHSVATKYKQLTVIDACERWLELNLVPQLSLQIYLSHLRQEVLEKLLKSSRLFTWNEYSLYKVLAFWIFLHQHPKLRVMPSWGSVVTWFMSLSKTSAFLDRAEGQGYTGLLRSLRLISITDSIHLDEIYKMNIIPHAWLLHIYSQNYHALQGGGGDMSLLTKFDQGAVRAGFILDQHIHYHSSMLSLHGFHFELKATQEEDGRHLFYLQRLRPDDPMSYSTTARHTFSLRQDREVRYSIRVQWEEDNATQVYSSGILSQAFGFDAKTNRSEVITLRDLPSPVYVTFSLVFPTS
ncbi:BTB/POZ domain-containing protein 16-like [Dendronephthya gigantea]|uniref:BTB/POZ domain-containing protein 16-like n=1 Tax=Dendronephthya gigantea TaxID=151771 RepID=UPI00106C4799|nr:BTB/POZ domain-containing protein 16-like [Dendronephthya gigantea]